MLGPRHQVLNWFVVQRSSTHRGVACHLLLSVLCYYSRIAFYSLGSEVLEVSCPGLSLVAESGWEVSVYGSKV